MTTELVLLGTGGGPTPKAERGSPASALRVGSSTYVIDCGNGVARQLVRACIPLGSLRALLITHHHADHNGDLGALLHAAWAHLEMPIPVIGPPPLRRVLTSYFEMQAYDIAMRCETDGREPLQSFVRTEEVVEAGVVFDDGTITITAARVRHPPIEYAFAYRLDSPDRSVVFSGDTIRLDAVADLAAGADVLVHEAMYTPAIEDMSRLLNRPDWGETMLERHTKVEDAASVAAKAGVRTLVLNHLFPPDTSVADQSWIDRARTCFGGQVVVGSDLLVV